jgi:biopolymer transport protein TolR
MAATIDTGSSEGGSGRRRGRKHRRPMAEINVTPMVDVMLVLLIIFMVTAPLLATGVPIELPETRAKQLPNPQKPPLVVTVNQDGRVFLGDEPKDIPIEELAPKLTAITNNNTGEKLYVYFRGDRRIPGYDAFMKVLARLNEAGFGSISFVTDVGDRSKQAANATK